MSMLPNKRVALLLLCIFVVVVLAALFIHHASQKKQVPTEEPDALTYALDTVSGQKDDDKDGLLNWEEALWKTDPHNPDTDNDGTPDGAEVDAGRSPVVRGPNDKLHIVAATTTETGTLDVDVSSTTQTRLFAQTFISTYLNTKLYGGSLENQVDTLTAIALPELSPPTQHTSTELTTTMNLSGNSIHTYGNISGGILKKNAPNVQNELGIILRAMYENNPAYIPDLLKTAEAYRKNAADLLTVTVPVDLQRRHVALINSFLLVARDIEAMSVVFDDPLTSLAGFKSYVTSSEELTNALKNIGVYLSNNTTYQESENGYIFTSSI